MLKRMTCSLLAFTAMMTPLAPLWAQEGEDDGHGHVQEPGAPVMEYPGGGVELPGLPLIVSVLGHDVLPKKGLFEVTKDVNVRSGPGTEFERASNLKAGDRVRAVGKTEDGEWTAVSKDGATLGFIHTALLMTVVDGKLAEPFYGSFMSTDKVGGVACDYRFRFERKSDVEGGDFETADYEVRLRCASQQGAALFYAQMFLTEAPVDEKQGLHLIGIDVRSIGDGMEEYLSTSYFYHPKTGAVTFDGHSLPQYALPPKAQTFQAKSIKDALKQVLEDSMASWTAEAWDSLFEKARPKAQ